VNTVYKCRQKSIPNYKSMSALRGIIVIFVICITKICTSVNDSIELLRGSITISFNIILGIIIITEALS